MNGNDGVDNVFLQDGRYRFESTGRLSTTPNSEDVKIFAKNKLAIPENALNDEARDSIAKFMTHHHLAIMRYETLLEREKNKRVIFIVFSFALLAFVPISIFLMSKYITGTSSNVIAQITAMLTGLLAVQKALSSWLDKRVIIGNFYRAQSNLKSNLYTFEDQWHGKVPIKKIKSASGGDPNQIVDTTFLAAMSESNKAAREVVVEEQTKFYDALTYPSIDVASVLKGAAETSSALTGRFRSAELALQETREKAAEESRNLRNQLAQTLITLNRHRDLLKGLVKTCEAALEVLPADPKDDKTKEERARLKKEISDLNDERSKLDHKAAKTEAELESLDAIEG